MNDYLSDAADAAADIADAGSPMLLTQSIAGVGGSHVTGVKATPTTNSYPLFCIISDGQAAAKYFPGTVIQSGDILILMQAVPGIVPRMNDIVTINGVVWSIKTVGIIQPGGVPLLYPLHLNK